MNFFKSVFADDDPEEQESPNQSSSPLSNSHQSPSPSTQPEPAWGFVGGFIKTLATKSESVIETYRRDLEEFSTGLKNETQVLKHVASSSLEVGASKAQESLESVGQAFDSFGSVVWKSTSQIINQGGNLLDGSDLDDSDVGSSNNVSGSGSGVGKYSRFESQLRGIQSDAGTFVEEPEDLGDYVKWKDGLDLEEKKEEIEGLMKENGKLEGIYKKVVPNLVDHDLFWCRYYYRVYKLEQAESVRAKLVERAKEDEDLSWDVDDDDDEEEDEDRDRNRDQDKDGDGDGDGDESKGIVKEVKEVKKVVIDEAESSSLDKNEVVADEKKDGDEKVALKDEKAVSEVSKDSDISVVSSQPSSRGEEEDMGWDEIEDLGSEDEEEDKRKGMESEGKSSPSKREELRKRLSVAEDDEDLSWDIEDDDEPIKKS